MWPSDTGCQRNLVLRRSGALPRPLGASYMGVLLMGLLPDGCLRAARGAAVPGIQAEQRHSLGSPLHCPTPLSLHPRILADCLTASASPRR